jgi:hypothetical protein
MQPYQLTCGNGEVWLEVSRFAALPAHCHRLALQLQDNFKGLSAVNDLSGF